MPSMGAGFDYHFLSMASVRGSWLLPLILMTGIVGFRLFVFDPLMRSFGKKTWEKNIKHQMGLFSRRWITRLLIFFAFMSIVALFHETLMISGKKITQIFPYLVTVLEKTHRGRIWVDRSLLLIALGTLWVSCLKRDNLSIRWFFLLLVLLSGTFSLIGHPADKGDFSWATLADILHLVAISLWIGGLFPLFHLLGIIRSSNLPEMNPFLTKIVERFSALAILCVVLVIGTGLFTVRNNWGRFPTWDLLLDSNYGEILLIKMLFVLGVLMLGGLSKFYILPGLRKTSTGNFSPLVSRFFVFLAIELILAAGVLISAFFLTQSTPPSRKDYGPISVRDHTVLEMPPHRPSQHGLLDVLAFSNKVGYAVPVADTCHILLDYRPFVKIVSHVMSGRTDDFHTAPSGLLVGPSANERWKKAVVDVDDAGRIAGNEGASQDLHIPS